MKTHFTVERGSSFNLTFTTTRPCSTEMITVLNVTNESSPVTYCTFNSSRSPCLTFGRDSACFCDARTKLYRVYINATGLRRERWKIDVGSRSPNIVTVEYHCKSVPANISTAIIIIIIIMILFL